MLKKNTTRLFLCTVVYCLLGFAFPLLMEAQPISRPAPFAIPTWDTSQSPVLPQPPDEIAGNHGAVHLSPEGHIIAADGTRLKFFGTELAFTAQFISSQDAKALANRLHKLGFNAVRLTYNDYYGWDDASLVQAYNQSGQIPQTNTANPAQFAKLDTLLYEFRQRGIYTFFVLNSYHRYTAADGVAHPDSTYNPAILAQYWDTKVVDLQKDWAKKVLTHVNPLTGLALGQDPAIPVVEMTQEQGLFEYWGFDRLNYYDTNNVLSKGKYTISYHQSRKLDTLFSLYLKKKYGSDAGINQAWAGPPITNNSNRVDNPSFEADDIGSWQFVAQNGAAATTSLFSPAKEGLYSELIRVTKLGPNKNWNDVVLYNSSPRLGADSLYKLTFWAKVAYNPANGIVKRSGVAIVIQSGYQAELNQQFEIDTTWKEFTYTFRAKQDGLHIIYMAFGGELGNVIVDNFSVTKQQDIGLYPGESLTASMVVRAPLSSAAQLNPKRLQDQVLFMDSLESSFFVPYHKYLKDTLKIKSLVNYSQANYWGTIGDYHTYSKADVTSSHGGWDYVRQRTDMPNTDSTLMVSNTPWLRDAGNFTLGIYGAGSVAHKAHIASHVTPKMNQFTAESGLLLPAYAAFQDWDGLFYTPYAWYREELFHDAQLKPGGYYYNSIVNNHTLLSLFPTASKLFREGLVSAATDTATITHDQTDLIRHAGRIGDLFGADGSLDPNILTTIGIRQEFDNKLHTVAAQYPYVSDTGTKATANGEIKWSQTGGFFTINTPGLIGYAGITGYDSVAFPSIRFNRTDASNDVSAVYYIALDTKDLQSAKYGLLTLATRTQNAGMRWRDSLGTRDWGRDTSVISAMAMHVRIQTGEDSLIIYPLDGRGIPSGERIVGSFMGNSGWSEAVIDQQAAPSTWFVVEHKPNTAAVALSEGETPAVISISPNPVRATGLIEISLKDQQKMRVELVDDLGRTVQLISNNMLHRGKNQFALSTANLPAGHYLLRVSGENNQQVKHIVVTK